MLLQILIWRVRFYGQLGDAYNGIGDNDKSDASYDAALRAKKDNDHVLNNYSYYLIVAQRKSRESVGDVCPTC